ncbi:MAG: transcription termination/antitermination protein NusA [Deltaproteobacteria bacterium]|nr:transcription termination/antitermination protein NusA [Deltaproteobacteria bacterium]
MEPNLNVVLDQVGKDKGIDKTVLVEALEAAMLTAARKRFGLTTDMEARFNEETGEVEVYEFKKIVRKVENRAAEIAFEEAKNLDPELTEESVGDDIGIKVESADFGRIAAQTAKQVIIQRVREAERSNVFNEYKDRKGELVTGIARRFERGNIVVDLGRAEAVLPIREQVPRENYRMGDRIQAYVLDVLEVSKGPQVILSRTHPGLLIKLFEQEVPEIAEGIVLIETAAREPGVRAKIAVSSKDYDVDPVGACVGMKGARVQSVVQELRGEKIDIVPFDEDPARFVCNALSPAEVSRVLIDEANHAMEIVVPDDQLSLAIGRRGQNVRLAAQLTGWKIDITSETKVQEQREVAFRSLSRIEGLSEFVVQTLYNHGFRSAQDVMEAEDDFLASLPGFSAEAVVRVKAAAGKVVEIEADERNQERMAARVDATVMMAVYDAAAREREKLGGSASEADHARLLTLEGVTGLVQARLIEVGFDSPEDLYFERDAQNVSAATGIPLGKAKQLCLSACEWAQKATGKKAPIWQEALHKADVDEAKNYDTVAHAPPAPPAAPVAAE